jgi:hypothetical protein
MDNFPDELPAASNIPAPDTPTASQTEADPPAVTKPGEPLRDYMHRG